MAARHILEIPLTPTPQILTVSLNKIAYQLSVIWRDAPTMDGGWVLDIADGATGDPIVQGIPLVTGADLLAQYQYLNIPGHMFVQTDYDLTAVPTFDNLGVTAHLYYEAP